MATSITANASEDFGDLQMRVGMGQFSDLGDGQLRFLRQLGLADLIIRGVGEADGDPTTLSIPPGSPPTVEDLVQVRSRIEDAGLRLSGIGGMPMGFYEGAMLGDERQADQLEDVKTLVENMGRAGIPLLGYHWSPNGVWRTSRTYRVRGGAQATAFDLDQLGDVPLTHGREYTDDELWATFERFLEAVLPVAEEAGVTLALHPADPPGIESIGGMPLLFRDFENFKRAMETVPSDNHGLKFCLGCWSEMGVDLEEVIRHFGGRDELVYIHFRDVVGTSPSFHETFVDEGNYDEYEIMSLLDEVGFSGVMIPDHVPHMEGDTDWGHRARAHAIGYLQATLNAVRRGR